MKYFATTITIYVCGVISLLLIAWGAFSMLVFLLIVVMNVLGFNLVKSKYKKHPELSVLTSTNDTLLLYLCKIGGCFSISIWLSFYYVSHTEDFTSAKTAKGLVILLFIILFNVTPSVNKGVKKIQGKYKSKKIINPAENGKQGKNGQN